jgi:hypothetical protein
MSMTDCWHQILASIVGGSFPAVNAIAGLMLKNRQQSNLKVELWYLATASHSDVEDMTAFLMEATGRTKASDFKAERHCIPEPGERRSRSRSSSHGKGGKKYTVRAPSAEAVAKRAHATG